METVKFTGSREISLSRRTLLGSALGGTITASFGSQEGSVMSTSSSSAKSPAGTAWAKDSLVDTHVHLSNLLLPGYPETKAPGSNVSLPPFDESKRAEGTTQLVKIFQQEMKAADIGQVLCMPLGGGVTREDPLAIREVELLIPLVEGAQLYPIGFAEPEKVKDKKHLDRVEAVLKLRKVKALKVFLGYYHFFPSHYGPYFRLAAKFDIPVIFHTGDPYSPKSKIKYADPMWIDEIAVDFPETKFVMAHFGNPWCDTAAEVVWKNENVWADLSGLWIGTAEKFETEYKNGVLDFQIARFRQWIEYAEKPNRFLFGSDWPLANLVAYRDFVRRMFPESEYKAVFRDNAKALFKI